MTTAYSPPPPMTTTTSTAGGKWRGCAASTRAGVVIWLAPIRQFRAYARLPGARRDTALTDPTFVGLAALISWAEQAAPARYPKEPT